MSPLVERFSFPKNLTRGKRLRVICTVTEGDLPLEVEWWKDGLKIEGSGSSPGKFGVQVRRIDEYTSLLAISFLETTHAGNYSCLAKNSVASFARSATLTIRGKFLSTFPVRFGSVFVSISGLKKCSLLTLPVRQKNQYFTVSGFRLSCFYFRLESVLYFRLSVNFKFLCLHFR